MNWHSHPLLLVCLALGVSAAFGLVHVAKSHSTLGPSEIPNGQKTGTR